MFHDRTWGRAIRPTVLVLGTTLTISPFVCATTTIHVDDDAPGGGDGATWATAFTHLQDALAAAEAEGDGEIRIGPGVYRPDRSAAEPTGTGDVQSTFTLLNGVVLRGGYAGFGAPDPDVRNPRMFTSTLSGDLAADDGPGFTNIADNAWHVLTAPTGTDATARLDGLTVTAGNADGPTQNDQYGGGLFAAVTSGPFIVDCVFVENRAFTRGGAIYCSSSNLAMTILRCVFKRNAAADPNNGLGGALFAFSTSPVVTCCQFLANTAGDGSGLSAGGGAAATFNSAGTLFTNCLFAGNSADRGGAMWNLINGNSIAKNCTIVANTAVSEGGGVYSNSGSNPKFDNSILWSNTDAGGSDASAQLHFGSGNPKVRYCAFQGGWGGSGGDNFNADPVFVDPDGADEDPLTFEDNDYQLGAGSPCVDAGRNWLAQADLTDEDADADLVERIPVDLLGEPRFADDPVAANTGCGGDVLVDLGAFESPGAALNPVLIGDTNDDGDVDFGDLLTLLGQWGSCGGCCLGDLNIGGEVNFADVLVLIGSWTQP